MQKKRKKKILGWHQLGNPGLKYILLLDVDLNTTVPLFQILLIILH